MKLQTSSLRSKVARRIFLLFIFCALVPILALAGLSFYQVSQQLREQSALQLQQTTKSQGMSTYERLDMLDADLQILAFQINGTGSMVVGNEVRSHFANLELLDERNTPKILTGHAFRTPNWTVDQMEHLGKDKPLLVTYPCSQGEGLCVQMVRILDPGNINGRKIAGEVVADYLWSADRLPAGLSICVLDGSSPLLCSDNSLIGSLKNQLAVSPSPSAVFQWSSQGSSYDAAYWNLFLNNQFHSRSWTFLLSQLHSDALVPMHRFRNLFPYVILLALWVVVLLSLIQIRRTMGPLEKLKEGTTQLRANNFAMRLEIDSGDEFEELASSFNVMTVQLEGQFQALTTINDIDQAILQSLQREGIIEGVLNHLPFLLPASYFGIAVFDSNFTSAELAVAEKVEGQWRKAIITSLLSTTDLEEIQQNPRFFAGTRKSRMPDFIGFASSAFIIFPIFLENKLFAALICAHDGSVVFSDDHLRHARQVADQLAVAFSNVQLIEALEQFHWGTLTALARAIDAKSPWTAGHSERVTAMAIRIAKAMGLSANDLKIMRRGGLLHDIGKIGTPADVLDKPGKLEPDELTTMRDHVRIGLRILEPIPAFKEALPIVAQHHEWFNGKGYPAGLAGDQISLHARVFAVADCYDALISDRPYRKGLPLERVEKMVREGSGTQFDPAVVEAFLEICRQEGVEMEMQMSASNSSQLVGPVQ